MTRVLTEYDAKVVRLWPLMVEMLRKLEWAHEGWRCVSCGGGPRTHKANCELAALLKEVE